MTLSLLKRALGYSNYSIVLFRPKSLVPRRGKIDASGRRHVTEQSRATAKDYVADTSETTGEHKRVSLSKQGKILLYALGGIVTTTGISLATRLWREDHIQQLPLASSCGAFYLHSNTLYHHQQVRRMSNSLTQGPDPDATGNIKPSTMPIKRDLSTLLQTTIRAGLMGQKKSVKEELEHIRKWHHSNGFHGGLVVRELTQPLYNIREQDNNIAAKEATTEQPIPIIHNLNQRECYYLYYEVRPDGQIRQQIFCRGTTLAADVWTGMQSMIMYKYDEELDCFLHKGFLDHANRLIADLQPLLVSNGEKGTANKRATVELCGHSLGGAVAIIVACKLVKRGYHVLQVTTIGAPRVCNWDAVHTLSNLLPIDTLRIENDLDLVCYLPPKGKGLFENKSSGYVGNKLLFSSDDLARFIPASASSQFKWVDSFLLNGRFPEMIKAMPKSHKVPTYSENIQRLILTLENSQ
jgi:hypothetical protein